MPILSKMKYRQIEVLKDKHQTVLYIFSNLIGIYNHKTGRTPDYYLITIPEPLLLFYISIHLYSYGVVTSSYSF